MPGQHGDADADEFAADLLLPAAGLARVDWVAISDTGLADLVWEWDVSVAALAQRLDRLTGSVPLRIRAWADQLVQRLLRRHGRADSVIDRINAATRRHFPTALQAAHLARIAPGDIGKGTLAWMLGTDRGRLDVDAPDHPEIGAAELARALGHRYSSAAA